VEESEEPRAPRNPLEADAVLRAQFDAVLDGVWTALARQGIAGADAGAAYLSTHQSLETCLDDGLLADVNPELYDLAWTVRGVVFALWNIENKPPEVRAGLHELSVTHYVDPDGSDWKQWLRAIDDLYGDQLFGQDFDDEPVRTLLHARRDQLAAADQQRKSEGQLAAAILDDLTASIREMYDLQGDKVRANALWLAAGLAFGAVESRSALSAKLFYPDFDKYLTDCGIPPDHLPRLQALARHMLDSMTEPEN
jgi:hypothetical protein